MGEYRLLAPSILRVAPVMKEAPGERRKQTAEETCKTKSKNYSMKITQCNLSNLTMFKNLSLKSFN
jgi:hypothetical protein